MERAEREAEASWSRSTIRFDQFELDAERRQLRRSGVPVDMPPQALRVLAVLAGRPDEVITRQEIKELLWPGQSFGDFDSRLNFAIKRIREGLGDDAEQPRYIQTVRNAGYRFIAPVREPQTRSAVLPNAVERSVPEGGALPESTSSPLQTGTRFRLSRGGVLIAVVAVVLVAVAAAAVLVLRSGKPVQSVAAEAKATPTNNIEYEPHIDSVSAILPQARQRFVITGRAFGLHVPYVHTDSPYLAIRDLSSHWSAGRMIPQNSDEVMVDVESWMDTEIVISGFSGDYGLNGWKLAAGDQLEVAVWNPQSGVGPALFHLTVAVAAP